jgi:hypothetical protein
MKRASLVVGLGLAAVAAAGVVLYASNSRRSVKSVEPRGAEAKAAQPLVPSEKTLNASIPAAPPKASGSDQEQGLTKPASHTKRIDEAASRKIVREQATRDVRRGYSRLLDDLEIPEQQKDALISLLTELQVAGTTTPFSRGRQVDDQERSRQIAAIIGESKLQQFLQLERDLPAYWEVENMSAIFNQNGVPLSDRQRDELQKIVVTTFEATRSPSKSISRLDPKPDSIEYLKRQLARMDEYEHHVLELAPSVLSSKQIEYLSDQYQYQSEQRARALQAQVKWKADHPNDSTPVWYPAQ